MDGIFGKLETGAIMILASTCCGALLIGCGNDSSKVVQLSENSSLVAAETAEEWVALADYVAVVTVEEERVDRPAQPGEGQAETGLSSYSVVIDRVVWEDPAAELIAPGATVEIFGAGWVFRPGDERPFFPHLEVGDRYLMPLGSFPSDGLGPLTFESIIPVDDSDALLDWKVQVEGDREMTIQSLPGPLSQRLPDEPSVDDVERLLASTEVPVDLRAEHVSPIDRYVALQEANG